MTSLCPPFFEKPQVRHPILFNWALLISRKPLQDHYRNPLSIGAMRIDALEASGAISEQVRMGSKTKRSFFLLSQNISMGVENFYVGDGCLKCVIYNLSLPQRPQIKQNLLKFFLRGLPTVDKIAHFTSVSPLCWLCRKAKESMCSQGEEGERQEKHNRKELKRMIYLYQQTEKREQMICDSREKGGKQHKTKERKTAKMV